MNRRILGGAAALILGALGTYFVTAGGGGVQGMAVGPCGVTVTSPARARDGKLHLRSGQSLTVSLVGTATRCPSTTLTRTYNDGGSTTISVNSAGAWSSSAVVADGVNTTITIAPVDGGSTSLVVDALTTAPQIVLTTPTRDDWDTWYLVSSKVDAGCGSGGNINAERFARPGYVSDVGCADGGQLNPSVTVTGASGGWLSVTWNGVPMVDAGISSTPATLTSAQLGTLTLPEYSAGELAFIASTSGGVATTLTTYATVRTTTPPALTGADGGSPVLTLLNARAARVQVAYVLPHVPVQVGAAHTEFAWTTGVVPCGGGGAAIRNTCYSLADGDAGYFGIASVSTAPATSPLCAAVTTVPDGGCAYGSALIWVKLDGGYSVANTAEYPNNTIPETGDRLGVGAFTRTTNCSGAVTAINPKSACVSAVPRPAANAYNISDGGGSARTDWDSYYAPGGLALSLGAYPVFDPLVPLYPAGDTGAAGYLWHRTEVQDCRLYDADSTPQVWKCVDNTTGYEGDLRNGVVTLPPLNNYGIVPVIAW